MLPLGCVALTMQLYAYFIIQNFQSRILSFKMEIHSRSVSEAMTHSNRFGRPWWSGRVGEIMLALQSYVTGRTMESNNYKP